MPTIAHADRTKPPRSSAPRATCPHCDAAAVTRSSVSATPLVREIYYQCTNVLCGHTFVATLEITRTVTPSNTPRAGVRLPMLSRGGNHRHIFPPDPPANDDQDQPVSQPSTG